MYLWPNDFDGSLRPSIPSSYTQIWSSSWKVTVSMLLSGQQILRYAKFTFIQMQNLFTAVGKFMKDYKNTNLC